MAAIVTNFLPDSPSQDNLKSPTTPTTPSAPFPGMGECNLFSPEDTLNGDDALIGELNAKVNAELEITRFCFCFFLTIALLVMAHSKSN